MKNILLAMVAVLLASGASAQVKWLRSVYDFGAFSEDMGAVDATFIFVNETDSPVKVIDARATCGCTRPDVPKEAVAPGDTAEIKVTYLAQGRPGRFSKNVYVRTSDDPSSQTTLVVKGTVIGASATLASRYPVTAGPMRLRTSTAGFGEVMRGKLKTVYVEAYNQSTDTLRPRLEGLPEYIDAVFTPAEVIPGEQTQLALTLQTVKVPEWGISTGGFTFYPSADAEPVNMDYFAIVSEDFSRLTPGERLNAPVAAIEPARVDLGEVSPGELCHAEFTVSNTGKSPLLVRRVQVVDEAVISATISSEKIKPGKKAKVRITVDPSKAKNDFINARITIITNDPENYLLTGRVTAEIIR